LKNNQIYVYYFGTENVFFSRRTYKKKKKSVANILNVAEKKNLKTGVKQHFRMKASPEEYLKSEEHFYIVLTLRTSFRLKSAVW